MIYNKLEHAHKKYGLMLHSSVFIFSLLLGIGIGIFVLFINMVETTEKAKMVKQQEIQIMEKLVKKIEAAAL